MIITDVNIEKFRNLKDIVFKPGENINVICGENGQGKTNIIEALWLLTGNKSFLGSKEAEMIPFDDDYSRCFISFKTSQRQQEIRYSLGRKKEIFLNDVKKSSFSALSGSFAAVIFSPDHLLSVKGASNLRRHMLDLVISQLKPRYLKLLVQNKRILTQRNSLLKEISKGKMKEEFLSEWDSALAKSSCLISKTRFTYCQKLFPAACEFYEGISGGREKLDFEFLSSGSNNFDSEDMINILEKERKNDICSGFSSIGCHRDDFKMFVNQKDLSLYGSQGQIRSAVLSIKLAESSLIYSIIGEQPVIFLDDVLSELDEKRQQYLLQSLNDRQIFISCCDYKQIQNASEILKISHGRVV